MATIGVKKINMVILMQTDLDAAVNFYKNLGFKQVFYSKGNWAEFTVGGMKVGLCPSEEEPLFGHTGIVLEVDDLETIYKDNQGIIEFVDKPYEADHGMLVSFKDPGGNVLDLYEPAADQAGCCSEQDDCCQGDEDQDCEEETQQCC